MPGEAARPPPNRPRLPARRSRGPPTRRPAPLPRPPASRRRSRCAPAAPRRRPAARPRRAPRRGRPAGRRGPRTRPQSRRTRTRRRRGCGSAAGCDNRRVDAIDEKILSELTTDARLPFGELGARVGLSANAAAARVRRMQADGTIAGFTVLRGRPAPPVRQATAGPAGLEVFVDVRLREGVTYEAFADAAARFRRSSTRPTSPGRTTTWCAPWSPTPRRWTLSAAPQDRRRRRPDLQPAWPCGPPPTDPRVDRDRRSRGHEGPLAHPPEPTCPCCLPALGGFSEMTPHEGSTSRVTQRPPGRPNGRTSQRRPDRPSQSPP